MITAEISRDTTQEVAEPSTGRLLTQSKEEYEKDQSRLRASELKWFLDPQGPRSYYFKKQQDREERDSGRVLETSPKVDHLVMGSLFHEFLLEGKEDWIEFNGTRTLTNADYTKILEKAGWTVAKIKTGEVYKSSRKGHYQKGDPKTKTVITGSGKPVLNAEEVKTLNAWKEGVMRSRQCRELLEAPRFDEQVIHWDVPIRFGCPATGKPVEMLIPCKAAIDIYQPSLIACLKTTRESSKERYIKQLYSIKYHVSAAMYAHGRSMIPGLGQCRFKHLVVMKEWPHHSYVWTVAPGFMRIGATDYMAALERYAICRHREDVLGADPMDAWPDDLEAGNDYLSPEDWMLTKEGIAHDSYDPGV